VLALQQVGYQPIVLDNLSSGNRDVVEDILKANLIVGDINDKSLLKQVFSSYNFSAIMHFAASIDVGESVLYPEKYYQNNKNKFNDYYKLKYQNNVLYRIGKIVRRRLHDYITKNDFLK
jgi:UDP-glucose 4-epimerase